VCIIRGRLFPPPFEIPSQNDESVWEGVIYLCESGTGERMCLCRLGEITRDDGLFGAIIQSELYRAYCCTVAGMG
jgi:hypothetical protein